MGLLKRSFSKNSEQLARLVTSSEHGVADKAWAELEKLPDREAAIEPLMKIFRSQRNIGNRLCKFLGNLGSNICRTPLLEILEYGRRSSNDYDQKYLVGSACSNLMKLEGGISALRPMVSAELVSFILVHGLMSADDKDRAQIIGQVTEADGRQKIVADLISFFRSRTDKADWSREVSGALGVLGAEAIEPLLEIFLTMRKFPLRDDGSIDKGRYESDKAGAPASNLIRAAGGPSALKLRLDRDLYEEVLLRAHNYGESSNPDVNKALGEIGDSRAIGRLIFVLWQTHWHEETRQSAVEALATIGKPAHSKLLDNLKVEMPSDWRQGQTIFRKEILKVLAISGDRSCVDTISEIARGDVAITEDAKKTLAAIAQRDHTVTITEPLENVPKKIQSPPATGNAYVDSCFQFEFEELDEPRIWHTIDDLKDIPRLAESGKADKALALAEASLHQYSDYDFLYVWIGRLKAELEYSGEPQKTYFEGLQRCRSKASLCDSMAMVEFNANNLSNAVMWWIKSCAIQLGGGRARNGFSFLNLAYIAAGLGLAECHYALLKQADRIDSRQVRFDAEGANQRYRLASSQGSASIKQAISLLCSYYVQDSARKA
jgi:hypothetical protein